LDPGGGFVTKLDPTGSALVYSTLTGLGPAGIALDRLGQAYVAGSSGTSAPAVAVAKLTPDGSAFAYYNDAVGPGAANAVAVDAGGSAYLTGATGGSSFPVVNAAQDALQGVSYASADGGSTWAASRAGLSHSTILAEVIDPANPSQVYAASAGGVLKSVDAGATWASAGLAGRAVNQLALDPTTPGTVYAATRAGVYKTTNGASDWIAANAGLPDPRNVTALALDPNSPGVAYAALDSGGLYRSADGAGSWALLYPPSTVQALAVEPGTTSALFAGTASGVYKTTDGGNTWVASGLAQQSVSLVSVSGADPRTLYALATGLTSGTSLYVSSNGGVSWTRVQIASGPAPNLSLLAFDPSNRLTLYSVGLPDPSGVTVNVLKSTDGGAHWAASGSAGPSLWASDGNTTGGFSSLAVDPTNPSRVYAAAQSSPRHAFALKLDPSGASPVYSTFIGGTASDVGRGGRH
jgi:photosystem II stability/assembly factor-like uncharacterized protein